MRQIHHLYAAIALVVWLILAIHTATEMSVTHDEFWHLPAGVRAWQRDFGVDRLNPPVSRLWAALPLVLRGMRLEPAEDASALGIQFVTKHADFQTWYVWGRILHLVWPLATAALIYYWCLQEFGPAAACLALLCVLTCPDVMAHGSVVTPDAAAMFGFVATSFCLHRWMRNPTWKTAILLGVTLGMLQGIKFTGVVFAPIMLIAGGWVLYRGISARWKLCGQLGVVLAVSLFVLAACYGFQGIGRPIGRFALQSESFRSWQQRLASLAALPVPLPADYLLGIDQQRMVMEQQHPIFLDGEWRVSGFISYYPKAVLYKLPHGFQLLILLGGLAAWLNRRTLSATILICLWGPVLVLFGLAMFSNMQLGLRYVMPLIPAFAWLAGQTASLVASLPIVQQRLAAVMVVAVLGWGLRYHPHHLAYFNEFAGGPLGGRYHLLDSNLDWGQDLLRARNYLLAHADEEPRFLYFGTVPPSLLGLENPFPPSRQPKPGLYLISVNFVMGRPHAAWQPDQTRRAIDFQEFSYFRQFEPAGHAGYSIDIYRLTADDIRKAALGGQSH